jgi:hypothetical protein
MAKRVCTEIIESRLANTLQGICNLPFIHTLVIVDLRQNMISLRKIAVFSGCAVIAATGLTILNVQEAKAAAIVLDFEGLRDLEEVNNFYNGGTGGSGSSGTNYGVQFSQTSLALIDQDAGGSGNIGGEPSPDTVLFFLSGAAATMNVAAGFDTGFSFFYSAPNNPGSINVYDGLNSTGNLLATLNLPLTASGGAPDPTGGFSPLVALGIAFSGTARSVDFGGTANQVVFDDITIGSATPGNNIPTPALLPGLIGLGAAAWRKRRNAVTVEA